MKIITDKAHISQSSERVFKFLSDFKNYSSLMTPDISDWKATEEHCTFKKDKFVSIGMQFESKTPNSEIKIVDYAKNAFPYSLTITIQSIDQNTCSTQMLFEATPNVFLKLVAEKTIIYFF